MRVVLSACLLLLAASAVSRAEGMDRTDFTFVQVCDPQLGMTDYGKDICAFRQAVKQINLLQPAFVLVCGDIVNTASPVSLSDFAKIASALTAPCHYAPGNHDQTLETAGDMAAVYRAAFGPDYHAFTLGGTRFVVINTDLMRRPSDVEMPLQMKWIESELAGAMEKGLVPVLVGHHPPFFRTDDEPDIYHSIPPPFRRTLLEWCDKYGVRLYLSGHTHGLIEHRRRGMLVFGGETTSTNFDGRPRGFRLWRVKTGCAPEPQSFVALYLREQTGPEPSRAAGIETGAVAQCRFNLRLLDAAKELAGMEAGLANGQTPDPNLVFSLIPGGATGLRCPEGGRYELGPLGGDPTCSVNTHALPSFLLPEESSARAALQPELRKGLRLPTGGSGTAK